jgi:hypothetical protein
MKIVQIGCHFGNDHVFDYVTEHKDSIEKIVLVDANDKALEKCKETYASFNNCDFIHAVIINDDHEQAEFFVPKYDPMSEQCSVSKYHVFSHNHATIDTVLMPAMNINALIEKYYPMDRLYIDAEGLDAILVSYIDFSKYKIPYIYFEHTHTDGPFKPGPLFGYCKQYLEENNYTVKSTSNNIGHGNTEATLNN